MPGQLLTSVAGGGGYAIAAMAAYLHLRHRSRWVLLVLRVGVLLAIGAGGAYLARALQAHGAVQTFQNSFDAALTLATLIGLVGVGTHLSSSLRGLAGLLFIVAALVEFAALAGLGPPSGEITSRPWFVSHSLAFAVSGTFFAAGGAAGAAYLLVNWMLRRKRAFTLVGRVPPLEALERFGRWMPILGFPLFTYGILTGFCGVAHRTDLRASAWYVDPVFLLSIVAWVVYGYLCYCVMYRPQLRGRWAATLSTCGLGLIVLAFVVREFVSPMHQ